MLPCIALPQRNVSGVGPLPTAPPHLGISLAWEERICRCEQHLSRTCLGQLHARAATQTKNMDPRHNRHKACCPAMSLTSAGPIDHSAPRPCQSPPNSLSIKAALAVLIFGLEQTEEQPLMSRSVAAATLTTLPPWTPKCQSPARARGRRVRARRLRHFPPAPPAAQPVLPAPRNRTTQAPRRQSHHHSD